MAIVSRGHRNLTLGLMMVVAILSYVDRQVFTLFQDDIKQELGLSDGQLGLLTGMSFALFYTLAAFPIARLADVGDRRKIIAVCVMVWSTATALCGIAAGFWQLMLARIGLAAGEAGAGPASSSLLTEIFPLVGAPASSRSCWRPMRWAFPAGWRWAAGCRTISPGARCS